MQIFQHECQLGNIKVTGLTRRYRAAQTDFVIVGKFLLSLNDVPAVRQTFAAFEMEAVETTYSVSPKQNSRRKKIGEVIISGP